MPRVVVDPDIHTKLPSNIILKACKELEKRALDDPPKGAKRTCQKEVEWEGKRVALVCQWVSIIEDGKPDYLIKVKWARELSPHGKSIRRG